jgi:hypothetical protein
MDARINGVWFALIVAGLMFASGYASLLLPREKAMRLATSRVVNAFGADLSVRWVRVIGVTLMLGAVGIGIAALTALLNNVAVLLPY